MKHAPKVLPKGFIERLDLSRAATPRLLKKSPVHRWFWFPHSYSPELVEAILDAWELRRGALLDPFAGAGTTLLVARDRELSAVGLDLSPLAVWVSNVKTQPWRRVPLQAQAKRILDRAYQLLKARSRAKLQETPTGRLGRALSPREYRALRALQVATEEEGGESREFFQLALLRVLTRFSRAVADGGWFRWVERPDQSANVLPAYEMQLQEMLQDVPKNSSQRERNSNGIRAIQHDARRIHELSLDQRFDVVITSPPYPNRHDYSRAFHIELLFFGLDELQITQLRHASLRSHVEAQAVLPSPKSYQEPEQLAALLENWPSKDLRVPRMLRGYFEDLYTTLRSMRDRLKLGARLAFVVGNVRHAGVMIPVDELLAEVGQQAGYRWTETWLIRLRGNSAQQMGRYGRIPARESVVFFEKIGRTRTGRRTNA
jgi:tRNA G10  N-methylase Trm11